MSDSTTAPSTTPAAAAAPASVAAPAPAADADAAAAAPTATSQHPIEQAIQATPQELGHKVSSFPSPVHALPPFESSRDETWGRGDAMRCDAGQHRTALGQRLEGFLAG